MWNEKFLKIIPAILFLFCLLEIFELVLIINDMNKTEKLEAQLRQNLEVLETITNLLNKHLEGMQLESFQYNEKHR
ncbi:hypothetical protein [Helicobacter pylori]|uniref:hypothetical protein n=1 Tax=Helicobacter pylori TaxID=210 RepID=UPI000957EF6E|nr:hypothetical protein [Helicobacter pylori]BAW36334.1 uncharacterized protein HPF13_0669 [Helicobacter pylori]BAW45542.1 uncharacterized protein HPF211_0660 [Helicobacter pylori]BAW59396.1 uncharacterized protein HPF67_0671 [Helicobacter pylori]BAW67343.1 uncharacterized protein HPF90_0727 [Helicobacter pylori]